MNTETIVKTFIKAIEARNIEQVTALLDDDVAFENIPEGSVVKGREATAEKFAGFFNNASSIDWDIEREIYSGDVAMIERVNRICFNNKDIELPMITVFEVKNGKVTLFRDYFDAQTFAKQVA